MQLDACGLQCPGPIVKVKEAMDSLPQGGRLKVRASDPGFAKDIPAWAACTGNKLLEVKSEGGAYTALLEKTSSSTPGAPCRPKIPGKEAGTTMVVFSNDLDRALAAFIIANGSAAMGMPVTMFFTFWGLNILRRDNQVPVKKNLLERMFGFMMPRGPNKLILSKMHMAGMGTSMMKGIMKSKRVNTLPELMAMAQKAGVRMVACSMSMDVMGIHREELVDGIEVAGVADFLGSASGSSTNLFI
jgi:peroxiredoxin family protein/TusA-related sulfurtransferase